jgi:hypothetical protein
MIQDTSRITLLDGTYAPAMEVYPGKSVLSLDYKGKSKSRVLERKVESREDVVCILLSNGQRLTGSRDQKVALYRDTHIRFSPLADVEIGDRLRGERAGIPVIVTVIGLLFDLNREFRLVGFEFDQGRNFVAEGVLCR